ncbi:hypothetical protein ADIS_0911 [Lunatimonas lonarensis]|uniref:Uncharacterized protein n=1 Tax=Lunatimonas lonarensis TaxID=1232681 RepID=R7ZWQ1_9BACT|nr:hypothetical protein ADIS_0911 [Lunatimonas lonarensis]
MIQCTKKDVYSDISKRNRDSPRFAKKLITLVNLVFGRFLSIFTTIENFAYT